MKVIETQEEFDEILKQGRPTIVDCFAEWCGPCILMGPVFEKWSKKYTNILFTKIDVDEAEELAESLGVDKLPTFLFYDNEGNLEEKFEGNDKQKLEALVDKFSEDNKDE